MDTVDTVQYILVDMHFDISAKNHLGKKKKNLNSLNEVELKRKISKQL